MYNVIGWYICVSKEYIIANVLWLKVTCQILTTTSNFTNKMESLFE